MRLHVESMMCGGCARGVTAALRALDPAAEVETDPGRRLVTVKTDRPRAAVEAALAAAGFPAAPAP